MRQWLRIMYSVCMGLEVIPLLGEVKREEQRVIVVRVRKGGTHALALALKDCSFAACEKAAECDDMPPNSRRLCSLHGSCLSRSSSAWLKKRAFVVTVVRDPIERVLLEFAHACARGHADYYSVEDWLRAAKIRSPRQCGANATVFESFLVAPAHFNGVRNGQTRMLAGGVAARDSVDARSESELYQIAVRNMGAVFDAVLVYEYFQESLIQLAKQLRLSPPAAYTTRRDWAYLKRRHGLDKPRLDSRALDLVRRLNGYDHLIHQRAIETLFSRSASYYRRAQAESFRRSHRETYYECAEFDSQQQQHPSTRCVLKDRYRSHSCLSK